MRLDVRTSVPLALGAALVATGAAIGSLVTWSLVPARACVSCGEVHATAPAGAARPASCAEGSAPDEAEVVELAQLAPRGGPRPTRPDAGLHLTRWPAPRQR